MATRPDPMTLDITALRALRQAGTPGRLRMYFTDNPRKYYVETEHGTLNGQGMRVGFIDRPDDATLIVAAVNALPALCDEVERLRRIERAVRDHMDAWKADESDDVKNESLRRLVHALDAPPTPKTTEGR